MWNIRVVTCIAAISIALFPVRMEVQAQCNIPQEIQDSCEKWGMEYNICPELLESIIYHESRFKPEVENGNCKGLMQINEPVQAGRMKKLGVTDIYDIDSNIHLGADLLNELYEDYSQDTATVLMLYHGEKNAIKKGNAGDVSRYAQSILDMSADLERAHGK